MFAMKEKGGKRMIGQICHSPLGLFQVRGEKVWLEHASIYQVSLETEGRFLPFRLKRVGALFRAQGVRRLLLPRDSPHWLILSRYGLSPYEPLPVLQCLGDWLLLEKLAQHGLPPAQQVVLLQGKSASPALWAVARGLCPFVKEIVISLPQGAEALQGQLYREFGMAVSSYRQSPTALLCFSTTEVKPPNIQPGQSRICLALDRLCSPDFQGIRLAKPMDPNSKLRLCQLAFLLDSGKISRESLEYT